MSALDLEQQEQLDQLSAFRKSYGGLVTGVATAVVLAYAAWSGWQYWQREQAKSAAQLFSQMTPAFEKNDNARVGQLFNELRQKYPNTSYASQAGLLAAKIEADRLQKPDAALAVLKWVEDNANEPAYVALARVRQAGLMLDAKKYDPALALLAGSVDPAFATIVHDRRGDIYLAQGKNDLAKTEYNAAYKASQVGDVIRPILEAKLLSLGAAPAPASGPANPPADR